MPWYQDRGLWVDVTSDGASTAVVRLAGEFDIASAEAARAAVEQLAADIKRIIVDLRQVAFIDAAGVGFLIAVRNRVTDAGKELFVRHPSRTVRRLLTLTQTPLPEAGGSFRLAGPSPDVVAICAEVVARAIHHSGADRGNVQILDPASGALRIAAQQGFERPFLDFFETVDDAESACGTALAERRPTLVPDVARSPIFAGTPALDVMLEAGALAVVSVPVLRNDGSVVAMISAHRREPTAWTGDQAGQLARLAAVTGQLLSFAS